MKNSPIQILESYIEKFHIEANADYDEDSNTQQETFELDSFHQCEPAPDFWENNPPVVKGVEPRTFTVRLGIRTSLKEGSPVSAYNFEMICSAIVICIPEKVNELSPEVAARQYGLTILFGVMREQLMTLSGRMPYGQRMLPFVSFLDAGRIPEPEVDNPKLGVVRKLP